MKKFALILAAALCVGSTSAMAEYASHKAEEDFAPYIGASLGVHNIQYSYISDDADYNAGLGHRFFSGEAAIGIKNKEIGFELFYKLSTNESREGRVGIEIDDDMTVGYLIPQSRNKFQWEGFGANAIYAIPLRRNAAIEITLGMGFYSGDIDVIVHDDPETVFVNESSYSPMYEHWNSTMGVSVGLGFSKRISGGLDFRGGYKYTMFKGDFLMDFDRQLYAGVRYVFE